MLRKDSSPTDRVYFDMSFSGLKTAVLNAVTGSNDLERDKASIARGFQDALVETLVEKSLRAAQTYGRKKIVIGGGVACNRTLAAAICARLEPLGVTVFTPSARLASDNAAMIARAGLFRYNLGERAPLDLSAYASAPLPGQS
jgi:N6-L-threonylcarbamoyladenine synthase